MNDIKQRLIAHDNAFEIIQQENIRMHEAFIELCLNELADDEIEVPVYDYCRVELDAKWSIGRYKYLTVNGKQHSGRNYIGYVTSQDVSIYVVSQGYDHVMFILNGKQNENI